MSAIFEQAIGYWRSVRDDFELYRAAQYERAEFECRGNLLSHEAADRGVTAWSLFMGPRARAEKWASEELREWWLVNGRVSFAEYERGVLDGVMPP